MAEQARKVPFSYKIFRIAAGVIVIVIAAIGGLAAWDLALRELMSSFF
ncbi:MAG: hypothetical protein L0H93_02110 [Nocardioides sp.]|nr:hypothetical protein [Nocardioides sp.]